LNLRTAAARVDAHVTILRSLVLESFEEVHCRLRIKCLLGYPLELAEVPHNLSLVQIRILFDQSFEALLGSLELALVVYFCWIDFRLSFFPTLECVIAESHA